MEYPLAYFALNDQYARRVSAVSGIPLAQAYLNYTQLYVAFGLGYTIDPTAAGWQEFLRGLESAPDAPAWMQACYRRLNPGHPLRKPERPFGCFSYEVWSEQRVHLHFFNPTPGYSPLRRAYLPERLRELAAMTADMRRSLPEDYTVIGGSWLYNIEAYRRLFPPQFLAAATQPEPQVQYFALWGQFLDHCGQVKAEMAARFLSALAQQDTLAGCLHCFPYPVLYTQCPLPVFCDYYQNIKSIPQIFLS